MKTYLYLLENLQFDEITYIHVSLLNNVALGVGESWDALVITSGFHQAQIIGAGLLHYLSKSSVFGFLDLICDEFPYLSTIVCDYNTILFNYIKHYNKSKQNCELQILIHPISIISEMLSLYRGRIVYPKC